MSDRNETGTMTASITGQDNVITGVSMDFTSYNNSRGNINVTTGGSSVTQANETSPYTRSWPSNGTTTSSTVALSFTRAGNNRPYDYHQITSITVTYQYYE
jgi:hypothetical protein